MLHRFSKISLFGRMEKFIVLAPLALLVLSIVEIFFLNLPGNKSALFFSFFLGDVLLFNVVHVVLTFPMLLHLPEFRSFRKEYDFAKAIPFWLHTGGIYVVFFAYNVFLVRYANELLAYRPGSWIFYLTAALFLPVSFIPVKHNLFQIKGFSIVYRHLAEKECPSGIDPRPILAREKLLFNLLLLCLTLQIFAFGEERHEVSALVHATLLKQIGFTASLGIAAWIVIDAFRADRHSQRPLYLMRVLFWPLTAYSCLAIVTMKGFHGLEYLAYYLRAPAGSSAESKDRRRYYLLGATLFFLLFAGQTALAYMAYNYPGWLRTTIIGPVTYAAMQAIAYVHFFMDREIYQMKRPENRRLVSPILYPVPKESPAPAPAVV